MAGNGKRLNGSQLGYRGKGPPDLDTLLALQLRARMRGHRLEAVRFAISRRPHRPLDQGQAGGEAKSGRRLDSPMSDDDKIYVDAGQPATLNNGAGKLTDYRTLRETVMAWHLLPPEQTKRATIKLIGGPVYTAAEIVHLHYGPRPT
jgi:hypothetical protein